MSKTSSAVKNRYNDKTYGRLEVRLPKDLVTRFKEACKDQGIPQAQIVREAVENFLADSPEQVQAAAAENKSVNEYIVDAINEHEQRKSAAYQPVRHKIQQKRN